MSSSHPCGWSPEHIQMVLSGLQRYPPGANQLGNILSDLRYKKSLDDLKALVAILRPPAAPINPQGSLEQKEKEATGHQKAKQVTRKVDGRNITEFVFFPGNEDTDSPYLLDLEQKEKTDPLPCSTTTGNADAVSPMADLEPEKKGAEAGPSQTGALPGSTTGKESMKAAVGLLDKVVKNLEDINEKVAYNIFSLKEVRKMISGIMK